MHSSNLSSVLVLVVLCLVFPWQTEARPVEAEGRTALLGLLAKVTSPLRSDPGEGQAWHLALSGEVGGRKGRVRLAWDGAARHFIDFEAEGLPSGRLAFGARESWLWVPGHSKLFVAEHEPIGDSSLVAKQEAWAVFARTAPALSGIGAALLLPKDLESSVEDDGTLALQLSKEFALRIRRQQGEPAGVQLLSGADGELEAELEIESWRQVPLAELDRLLVRPASDEIEEQSVDIAHLRGMIRTLADLAAEKVLARVNPKLIPDPLLGVPRVEGVALVQFAGSPEDMGRQHGELLRKGVWYNLHRTLHGVGLAATVETGKWFPGELKRAWKATRKHIPERYVREIDALSAAAGLPQEWGRSVSVFPEIFHCSGIAVRGKATVDGKIYHGRVLDYMTDIGLQNTAVVTVHRPDEGRHAWINVGYAGLCGTVTAMNARGLAMGEMGGRGEGYWDGLPMTFLMREVVERFDSTADALSWMRSVPRTCEYFYVLSDSRTRSMAGVASLAHALAAERGQPDLRVIEPGKSYEELPTAIEDAVLMSAGKRYSCLVGRVEELHGKLDMESVWQILGEGVAMGSNLHSVLFAPESLELWAAQAGPNGEPAYTQPIAKLSLADLLEQPTGEVKTASAETPAGR